METGIHTGILSASQASAEAKRLAVSTLGILLLLLSLLLVLGLLH